MAQQNDLTALMRIREGSVATLRTIGEVVNSDLPLLEASRIVRPHDEIICRALAMHCVAAAAFGFDRIRALEWLEKESSQEALTPRERRFLMTGCGDGQQFANQVEAVFALAWSLQIVPVLDCAKLCPDDFVGRMPNLNKNESAQVIRTTASLRPTEEILAAADLAYCLHWTMRSHQIKNEPPSVSIEPDVVTERRRAFEWMLADESWDDISLDT